MTSKFLWNEGELVLINPLDQRPSITYSISSLELPYPECCLCEFADKSSCSQELEEVAFDLSCNIFDRIISSSEKPQFQTILSSLKKQFVSFVPVEKATPSFLFCLKIHLLHEAEAYFNILVSEKEKTEFLFADVVR